MSSHRWSRRELMGLVQTAAVASALRSVRVEAQTAIPRRIVLFFTPHGTVFNQWRPTGTETAFNLSYILSPLAAFKSKLVVLDGVGLPAGGPGAPHTRNPEVLFTGSPLANDGTFQRSDGAGGFTFGWNTYRSVDQEIANRLGTTTPHKSLEFGVKSGGGFPGAYISYAGPAAPMAPRVDPYLAFQQLFSNVQQSGGSGPDPAKVAELTRRQDITNAITGDLSALRTRVSSSDLVRLNAQADSIAEIQRSLQASLPMGSPACVPPTVTAKALSAPDFRTWAMDRNIEMVAASLACGLTRVASLQYRLGENDSGGDGVYNWLGQTAEHHNLSHDTSAGAQSQLTEIYKWYAQRFNYLLQKLDSYPESDGGTVLDHTMVIWASELGNGYSHDSTNVPMVIAGGGHRGVRTGRYMVVPAGTKNNRLLVSMANYMGYNDVLKFGTFDTGSGPLPGLLA